MGTPPPFWQRQHLMHGLRTDESHQEGVIGDNCPRGVSDMRGLILSNAEEVKGHAAYYVDMIAARLGLPPGRDTHWWRTRQVLIGVTERHFAGVEAACCWLHYESCRESMSKQAPRVGQATYAYNWKMAPLKDGARDRYSFRSMNRRAGTIRLPTAGLRLIDKYGEPRRTLVYQARKRKLMSDTRQFGVFEAWFATNRDEDREGVLGGALPPMDRLWRLGASGRCEINVGHMVSWVKLDRPGLYDSITIDLHPDTSEVVAFRRAYVPLEFQLRNHERYQELLHAIIDGERVEGIGFEAPPQVDPRVAHALAERVAEGHEISMRRWQVLKTFAERGSLRGTAKDLRERGIAVGEGKVVADHLRRLAEMTGLPMFEPSRPPGSSAPIPHSPTVYAQAMAQEVARSLKYRGEVH